MSTQKFNAFAKQPASRLDPPDAGKARGATFDEQQRRIAQHKASLARLCRGEINSGLVFSCQIRGLPEEHVSSHGI